jgi:hypothetical protein
MLKPRKINQFLTYSGFNELIDHYEYQNMGGCIILKWILERSDAMVCTGLSWRVHLNTVISIQVPL